MINLSRTLCFTVTRGLFTPKQQKWRDKWASCLGAPFYAGWGLTTDIADTPDRRTARPSLDQFTHATLIDYPRYYDPETGYPCPPEVAVDRLAVSKGNYSGLGLRLLAKAQGALSTYAHLWR